MRNLIFDPSAVKRIREKRGLDQSELSQLARIARTNIGYLERGVTDPRASTLARLASVLGCSPAAFFKDEAAA